MRSDQRQRTVWLLGLVAVALLVVASNAGVFRSFAADDIDSGQAARRALVGGAAGLLVVAAVVAAVRRSGSGSRLTTAAFGTATIVAFAALFVTAFAAAGASTATDPPTVHVDRDEPTRVTSSPASLPPLEPLDDGERDDPTDHDLGWIVTVFQIAGAALVVYIASRLWAMRRRRRARTGPPSAQDPTFAQPVPPDLIEIDNEAAADSFAESVRALLDDDDPRRAIIAAYAALLEGLEAAGAGRRPHEAPEEHLRRSLNQLRVPAEALAEVTRLFLVAKFSHHPMDEADRSRARSMLALAEQHLRALQVSR